MECHCGSSYPLWNDPYFTTTMTFPTVTPLTTEIVSRHNKNTRARFPDEHYLEPLLAFSTVGTGKFWNPDPTRTGR